jgi:hypothetical protein
LALFLVQAAEAQTWNQDISYIVYDHCGKCHHDGGIAPQSFMTYTQASGLAADMLQQVVEGNMPPWPADNHYITLVDENVLTDDEINAISNWVSNGAPEGTGTAPIAPTYNDGFAITNPDMVISIPDYEVPLDVDQYRSFVMTTGTTEVKNIGSIEFEPGNTDIVHHVLAWYDPSNLPAQYDAADPGPGWTSSGGSFPSDNAVLIGVWVPGMGFTEFPTNMAIPMPAGSNIVMEVHYAPGSIGQTAPVKLRLKFKTDATIREVYHDPLLVHFPPSLQEPALAIPPNAITTFHEQSIQTAPVALSFLSVFPHMHLLGKQFKVYGLTPQQDTVRFVNVDQYDFHWQFSYKFPSLLKLPAGSRLHGEATYDNTDSNEDNPNSPPQWVYLGEGTTDEMMICFFMYTAYFPGDENISQTAVYEVTNDVQTRLWVYPNPTSEKLFVDYPNHVKQVSKVWMSDVSGRLTEVRFLNGQGRMELDVSNLPAGNYVLSMQSDKAIFSSPVVISR